MDPIRSLLKKISKMSPYYKIPTLLGFVVQCVQEDLTTQTWNFNYKKSSLLKKVIYYYIILFFILTTKPNTIKPCRPSHEP